MFFAALAEGLEEGFRTRMGDGAEVLHQFLASHADAEVLDRNRLRLVIGRDVDLKVETVVEDFLFGELSVPQLFERVGGIRHQLTDEDFLLGVEGMDDDIEQLLDLGLELELLRCGGGHEFEEMKGER